MKNYITANWDGWPLHGLIATFLSWCIITLDPATVFLCINSVFWIDREATQHDGYANVWTLHRILEWGVPTLMGIICYVGWSLK